MRRSIPLLLACLAAAPAAAEEGVSAAKSAPPDKGAARQMTFDQALQLATEGSPDVAIAEEGVNAAEARVKGVKAQRLPRFHIDANILRWDDEIAVSFAPPGTPPDMLPPPFVVREQITGSATFSAAQPISALLVLGTMIDLEQAGVDASRAESDRAKLDAGARAAEAYLRLLQARAVRDVAAKSVAQVEANLDRVRKLRAAGAAGDLDVYRLEAGRDAAKQGLLRAEAGVEIGERALVLTVNLPTGTQLDISDSFPDPPPVPTIGPDEAADLALKKRPELRAARERAEQAAYGQKAAKATLLPNILAIGQYQHSEGNGSLQPQDSWFVGLTLSWDIWDWGKNFAAVDEAAAHKLQAKIGAQAVADQVAFDARRRALDVNSAYQSLAVAKSALTSAEEAYRLQNIRNEQGVATTTDVLDAETEVARARTGSVVARYDYFLSLVALMRSVGNLPSVP